jgi:hypothetical protein
MYCALRIGDVCVIESLVGSLIGSAILTAIATGVVWLFTYEKRKAARERYEQLRREAVATAKKAYLRGDYHVSIQALIPFQETPEIIALKGKIDERGTQLAAVGPLIKANRAAELVPHLSQLAEGGHLSCQFMLGMILTKSEGVAGPETRVPGAQWLAIALKRGEPRARKELDLAQERLTLMEISDAHRRAERWIADFEARNRDGNLT